MTTPTKKIKRTINYLVNFGKENKSYIYLATASGVTGFVLTGDPLKGIGTSTMTGFIFLQYKLKEKN